MPKIIIPTPLRKFTDNESSVNTEGKTVKEAMLDLAARYPGIRKNILTDSEHLQPYVRIYVNDDDINSLEKEDTSVTEEATISIIPAIAGGCRL